ncbi:MAG: hypothetical protein GXP31_16630 [Kiritimatiellaeota bacterium]|nr:hypothetical protein [Kiritimatiellota bacterium]
MQMQVRRCIIITVFGAYGLLRFGTAAAYSESFRMLQNFDYPVGWRASDVDCTVDRVSDQRLVREGKGCMRLRFRVAPEDVGKKHWIVAARCDVMFMPPRRIRLWVQASAAGPLFFSLRDEAGVESIWRIQPTSVGKWERVTLEPDAAEFVSLCKGGAAVLTKPVVRLALFVRCESMKKAGKYQFLVDGLEVVPPGAMPPPAKTTKRIDAVTDPRIVKATGCKVAAEPKAGLFAGGNDALRVEWRVAGAGEEPRWRSVVVEGLRTPVPRAITFWIRPERKFPLSLNLDDADGTRITWSLPALRIGHWNFVRLNIDEATKWLRQTHAKGPFGNTWADSPIMRLQFVLDRDAIEEPGDYVCRFADVRMVYNADIFPADDARTAGERFEKRVFSEGEEATGRFSFSMPRNTRLTATLNVRQTSGKKKEVLRVQRTFPADRGRRSVGFRFAASAFPVGNYDVSVRLRAPSGNLVFHGEESIRRITPTARVAGFLQRFELLGEHAVRLDALLERARRKGGEPVYLNVARATLRHFIPVSRSFAYDGKFDRVERHLRFMESLAHNALDEAREVVAQPKRAAAIPPEHLASLRIRDGNLYADGNPVVLIGPMGIPKGEVDEIPKFGFNLADSWDGWPTCMRTVLRGPEEVDLHGTATLAKSWVRARSSGVALTFCPALRFPFWAYRKYPDTAGYGPVQAGATNGWRHIPAPKLCGTTFWRFCMEAPNTTRLVRRYYEVLFRRLVHLPKPRIYWLMNEPAYRSRTPLYLHLFRKDLRRKYRDIHALNTVWGTKLQSFDQATFPKRANKAAWFDWLDFHQRQVSHWFRWLRGEVKTFDDSAMVTNKPTQICLFKPTAGVDMAEQAHTFDLAGCDTWRDYTPKAEFALEILGRGPWKGLGVMTLDFFKSAAPEKPIADLEYHFAHSQRIKEYPAAYPRAAFWQSFLHGMRLCCFWVWNSEYREDTMVQYPPFARPRVAWALGTTALDLRRLSTFVSLFPPKPSEIALLYSRSSVFLDPERTFNETLTAYKSLFFLDAPVGFITEQRITEGGLNHRESRPKLLVIAGARYVPAAVFDRIGAYTQTGGRVILLGRDVLAFDEHGRKRRPDTLSRLADMQRFPSQWAEKLSHRFDALLDEVGVSRPVRILGQDGKNAWGVESRSVIHNGHPVTYIINMRSEPVTVRMYGFPPDAAFMDLIESKSHRSPVLNLRPLQVALLTPTVN